MGGAGSFGLGPNPQTARNGPASARIRNSRAPAGLRRNGWPFRLQRSDIRGSWGLFMAVGAFLLEDVALAKTVCKHFNHKT